MSRHGLHKQDILDRARAGSRRRVQQEWPALVRQQPHLLRLVSNEAEALAWETGLPWLFLPELLLEKARRLWRWQSRQGHLRHASGIAPPEKSP